MTPRTQQVSLLFLLPPQVFLRESQAPWPSDTGHGVLRSQFPAEKTAGAGSTMVTNHGVGIHLQGAIGAGKRPLTSQSSCVHVPGSTDPEVGMGILAAVVIP